MKKINGHQFIQMFEQFSPKRHALEGDPIGLHVGTLNKQINTVMIALDVMPHVVDEAIEKQVDLIIAHHPLIYRPLKNVSTEQPSGKLIEKLIKHDIAVYAAHTNLDVSTGGVNDMLASALKLQNTSILVPTASDESEQLGLGRIGELSEEMSLEAFAQYVKSSLDSNGVRVVGNLDERVKKVAILGGDGNKYIHNAKFKGADVYVTGDIYYHTAHDAMNIGLNIVDPGHNVEKIMKKGLTDVLKKLSKEQKYDVKIIPSELNTDPFIYV